MEMMTFETEQPLQSYDVKATNKAKILIADDETLASKPLRKILLSQGYQVDCVDDGFKATEQLKRGEYDLLVTDICMPGNGALDVLRSARLHAQQIPVIVITAYPSVETAIDALRLSVVDYCVKPIVPKAFLESVRRALARRKALETVRTIEERLGNVTAVLESFKSTLETAGEPLIGASGLRGLSVSDHDLKVRLEAPEFSTLSRREREILWMIARGQSTMEAAESLGITVSTVRNHLKSIYRKVDVTSQVALVRKVLT